MRHWLDGVDARRVLVVAGPLASRAMRGASMVSVALVVKEVPPEETKGEVAAFLSGAVEMLNARASRLACVKRGAGKGIHRVEHAG
jgi:hypothetical protein